MTGQTRDPRGTFAPSAPRYLVSSDHQTGPDLDVIRAVAAARGPVLSVDVATGAGHALRAAAPFSAHCAGMDLTLEMLQVARRHLAKAGFEKARFTQCAAHALPLREGAVSLLTCRIAPHHFPSVPLFLEEVFRVLAMDGRGVIIDSIAPEDLDADLFINRVERFRDPSHIRTHTLEQWISFFGEANLTVLETLTFRRRHPFGEWARRVGLGEEEVAQLAGMFLAAAPSVQQRFAVEVDAGRDVLSYTDEKGVFVVKRG